MIAVSEYTCRTLLLYIILLSVCLLNVPHPIRDVVRKKCVVLSVAVQLESSRRRSSRATLASKALGRDINISFGRHITTAPQAEKNM